MKSIIPITIIALSCCVLSARATNIPIPNFSFESPDALGSNGSDNYTNSIDDFTASGTGSDGTQYNSTSLFATIPNGNQFGFLNVGDAVPETIESGAIPNFTIDTRTTYTLSLYVGNRGDSPYADNGTYTLSFYDNGVAVATTTLGAGTKTGSSITPGTFVPLSASYSPLTGEGNAITVGVTFTGGVPGFAQGDVDDFTLSSAPRTVPEPTSYALLAGGLLVLVATVRRKRHLS